MACIYGLFGILLPATAIDRPMSLKTSLTLWKAHGWRLTLIVVLVTLPLTGIGILHGEIDGLISETQQTHAQKLLFVVSVFVSILEAFIMTTLIAAALSIVYAEVNGKSAAN